MKMAEVLLFGILFAKFQAKSPTAALAKSPVIPIIAPIKTSHC